MSPEGDSTTRDIRRGVIAVYKDNLGRGPTDAQTEITEISAITTVSGSLTKAEQSLVAEGKAELVREMRRNFQDAMREDITAVVETATGRECATFLSDHNVESDIAVEMVLFKVP